MNKKLLVQLTANFLLLTGLITLSVISVYAGDPDLTVNQSELGFAVPNLGDILTFGIRGFFTVAGIVALGFLLAGGLSWVTSSGDEEAVGKARDKITAAVIGVIVIVAVVAVIVTLEQAVFSETICFGISCAATIPNLLQPYTSP